MNTSQIVTTVFSVILFFCPITTDAGERYRFRVYLKDKGDAGYSVEKASDFLSAKAIERRQKNDIAVTASDFPISYVYLDSLCAVGVTPIVQSKWLSTVVVESADSLLINDLKDLSIVDSVKWVWKGQGVVEPSVSDDVAGADDTILTSTRQRTKKHYGYANDQIKMLNGIKLHKSGFQGEGMFVAILDAGFKNVDRISAFESLKLLGTRNFVNPHLSVFEGDNHGTKVLSCMAANIPGIMVGTAPQAYYWLLTTEDINSEYPVEEDYWAAAVEFADSVGVDVISSSLGYYDFDADELGYSTDDLDGRTALITRVAQAATDKGILLFSSAGNEGSSSWKQITFPADAVDVITVGSVTEKKDRSSFSSIGFTSDLRVKPDLVALGTASSVVNSLGEVSYVSGTSFSTPTIAGLGVCLWQALPLLTNKEIIELLRTTASQHKRPDEELGYGIPDVFKAYKKGRKHVPKSK